MSDYDIGAAFEEIEDELISPMIKNLRRYKVEDITESMEWAKWQAFQLQELEDYKRKVSQKFGARFSEINDKVEESLRTAYGNAAEEQEREILKNIRTASQNTIPFTGNSGNERLDKLINTTADDIKRAESAVLRMANDKYRRIIHNTQFYADSGAATYEKAVDTATKDFLSAGINCIEYKDGRRVNIRSYAEMLDRTAKKRACLQGEGDVRKKWGIHTVIIKKRNNPCPLCAPFVGKVIVDDVWSGGTVEEAKESGYPLMSECIKQGLYHPNCQDSHATYFENDSDEEPLTEEEQKHNQEIYKAEQKQSYCERQAKRMERMGKYSIDGDNRRIYRHRADNWKSKASEFKDSVREMKNDVANSENGGIIKLNTDLKKLSNSETYSSRGINIPDNLKSHLEKLKSANDYISGEAGSFAMKDLSTMSKETGVEFACVTVGDKSYLIRGNETGTSIPKNILDNIIKNNGVLDFHSHPHDGDCIPSMSDRNVMEMLENATGQKTSKIVTTDNQVVEFDKFGVRSLDTIENDIDEEYAKALIELFGG